MAMTGIYSNTDTIITEDKQQAVRRFGEMQADGWQALKSMTDDELAALKLQVDESAVVLEMGHPHNEMRRATYKAITAESVRRQLEIKRRRELQAERKAKVSKAAQLIDEASKLVESAYSIELAPDALVLSPEVPDVDIATATDDELIQACNTCQLIVGEYRRDSAAYAQCIATLKGKAAKAIGDELRAEAKAVEERKAKASAMQTLIATEQERRKAERLAEAEALKPEAMSARIAELEKALRSGNQAD